MSASPTCPGPAELRTLIEQWLDDDKASDVITIDLAGKTAIADYMIVATGTSTRQVTAMAEKTIQRAKEAGVPAVRVEGLRQGDWVLIDCGDVIVHVFRPEVREFYGIEKMWGLDGEIAAASAPTARPAAL